MMVYWSSGSLTVLANVTEPSEKLPLCAEVCVARPGVSETKGVQAPREAMQECTLACGTSWNPCHQPCVRRGTQTHEYIIQWTGPLEGGQT